jgi:hypothetical protein
MAPFASIRYRPCRGDNSPLLGSARKTDLTAMVVPANPGVVMEFYWRDLSGESVRCAE